MTAMIFLTMSVCSFSAWLPTSAYFCMSQDTIAEALCFPLAALPGCLDSRWTSTLYTSTQSMSSIFRDCAPCYLFALPPKACSIYLSILFRSCSTKFG